MVAALACSGRNGLENVVVSGGAGGVSGSTSWGGAVSGGVPGEGGTTAAGGSTSAGGSGLECVRPADCPSPKGPCALADCRSGRCTLTYTPKGSALLLDEPPDCHATVCDGQGNSLLVLALNNVPSADAECFVGVCDAQGAPVAVPAPAGAPCSAAGGGQRCDGVGNCVQCLTTSNCAVGQDCVQFQCVSSKCANGVRDSDEIGVDCGGSCGPCEHRCNNAQQDGDETDVDCGGGWCGACHDSAHCKTDQDCISDVCDPLRRICLPESCIDQRQDGDETDVDCGGSACGGCYTEQKCLTDSDCSAQKCDQARLICLGNSCADHIEDGDESDVDCGGLYCGGCASGKKCNTGFDCYTFCSTAVIPHVCL